MRHKWAGMGRTAALMCLLPALLPPLWAQMPLPPQPEEPEQPEEQAPPQAPPQKPQPPQAAQPSAEQDTHLNGMPKNPHIFGMEIPLLDPANDMVSYNGGKYDVGNNAVLRGRFEKFLQQSPEDSENFKKYHQQIDKILDACKRRGGWGEWEVGSRVLLTVGMSLYKIADYKMDDGQSGALASAIASILDAYRKNLSRKQENKRLEREIEYLSKITNRYWNRMQSSGKDAYLAQQGAAKVAAKEAKVVANEAANAAALAAAKINYQGLVVTFMVQRRFDHALIGARCYRQLFHDGDTQLELKEGSEASRIFEGLSGFPPTINILDALANAARNDVKHHMEAVHSLMAQRRMADATQHLIQAVALGEYMPCVSTFPREKRQRIATYWDLRKRSQTALNARDYATAEKLAGEMKAMDSHYDDSMLRGFCSGNMRRSDLCIRNAMIALQKGNNDEFNRQIAEATVIWPLNPKLDKGEKQLADFDNQLPVKEEFRLLYKDREYRRIYNNQERYEVAVIDPELRESYKEVITLVSTIDVLIKELHEVAEQDRVMGPCMAYEKLLARQKADERYAADDVFRSELQAYAVKAHAFVKHLDDAAEWERLREFGSALTCYFRAQRLYAGSALAREGIERMTDIILKANY